MAEGEVLVLGAGFAGLNAALELARKGFDVKLVDRSGTHEYTPGIIDEIRDRWSSGKIELDLEDFLEGTGIEFIQTEIEDIYPGNSTVETGEGEFRYGELAVCLGGEPRTFGIDVSECCKPYSMEEARKLEGLENDATVAIVGSGYVGIEIAGELAEKGHEVQMIDRATRPMPRAPEKASRVALDYLQRKDIFFRGGKNVTGISEGVLETEEGDEIEADVIVWAGGVKAPEMVQESFDCGPEGIEVNSGLSSEEYDDVLAAGDCAADGSLKTAHNAMEQAKIVAANAGRREGERLEEFSEGTSPLAVSMGKDGMMIYGDLVIHSRLMRLLKDAVRLRYWTLLYWRRLRLKLSI